MVNGVAGSRPGIGSVVRIWRRSGSTGRSTPAISPTDRDHAPAVHTTVSVAIRPAPVSTARTCPSMTSIPVTAQCVTMRAPARRAPPAYPRTTDSGVQCPSSGDQAAARIPSISTIGESAFASADEIIRLGTPREFCSATFASNAATWSGLSSRKR